MTSWECECEREWTSKRGNPNSGEGFVTERNQMNKYQAWIFNNTSWCDLWCLTRRIKSSQGSLLRNEEAGMEMEHEISPSCTLLKISCCQVHWPRPRSQKRSEIAERLWSTFQSLGWDGRSECGKQPKRYKPGTMSKFSRKAKTFEPMIAAISIKWLPEFRKKSLIHSEGKGPKTSKNGEIWHFVPSPRVAKHN
jgi:hypothetical protein